MCVGSFFLLDAFFLLNARLLRQLLSEEGRLRSFFSMRACLATAAIVWDLSSYCKPATAELHAYGIFLLAAGLPRQQHAMRGVLYRSVGSARDLPCARLPRQLHACAL